MLTNYFTIKDLENLSGIKAHTIRIWEQRYNFIKPNRTESNIRYYTGEELKTLLNVSLLNKYGFKISKINKFSGEELQEQVLNLSQSEAQQERLINELIQYMIELDVQKFESVLDNIIHAKGVEKVITYLIFPFLERIGILWLTNHINPAQEHLISNLIRQKIIAGIDKMGSGHTGKHRVLLFLPEAEYHEIGLLLLYFILKAKGVNVIYLGTSVPLKDVKYITEILKPDYLFTHLTSVGKNFNFQKFLDNISTVIPNTQFIISGRQVNDYKNQPPKNVQFKYSFNSVTDFISTL